MYVKCRLRPHHISINDGWAIHVADPSGLIMPGSVNGFYVADTRLVSEWQPFANGQAWEARAGSLISYHESKHVLTNSPFMTEDGLVVAGTLALTIRRSIFGSLREDVSITNYSNKPQAFLFTISVRSDFADLLELRLGKSFERGEIDAHWEAGLQELEIVYRNDYIADRQAFSRKLVLAVQSGDRQARYANGQLSFNVSIGRGQAWQFTLRYHTTDVGGAISHPFHSDEAGRGSETAWRQSLLELRTDNQNINDQFNQAVEDMAALRLQIPGLPSNCHVPAAGIPWFATVFGRDCLIASMQFLMVDQRYAFGSLKILADAQGTRIDDSRDEQPGRIFHELRYGEPSALGLNLFTPYYGTADATPLYLIALHTTWLWNGDVALLERHLATAEKCLKWIDDFGDLDGDGFQEYATASNAGYENLGWKDSFDSVVDVDGTIVTGPGKSVCELQGYVYDAWVRMADIYHVLGQKGRADLLRNRARQLFDKFNEVFWDDSLGCYAYGLDGGKRKILTIASNAGHCLWSGIVPRDRAVKVAERLLQPDMLSGWGVRTLSAKNPAFNPYSYHNGSVWPHDNSLIAFGFRKYGLVSEANQIIHDISDAATHFRHNQLPEFYAGLQRSEGSISNLTGEVYTLGTKSPDWAMSDFPVDCPQASAPQAWAAGSTFLLIQSMLGIQPDALHSCLYVDPHLPSWLSSINLSNVSIGTKRVSIRFWRDKDQASLFEVIDGNADVIRRPFMDTANLIPLK